MKKIISSNSDIMKPPLNDSKLRHTIPTGSYILNPRN